MLVGPAEQGRESGAAPPRTLRLVSTVAPLRMPVWARGTPWDNAIPSTESQNSDRGMPCASMASKIWFVDPPAANCRVRCCPPGRMAVMETRAAADDSGKDVADITRSPPVASRGGWGSGSCCVVTRGGWVAWVRAGRVEVGRRGVLSARAPKGMPAGVSVLAWRAIWMPARATAAEVMVLQIACPAVA